MLSRSAISRTSQLALRRQHVACARSHCRAFSAASAPTGSSSFETTNIAGVPVVSKDGQGPTTKLVVVAKAGTRYQPAPGLTAGLESFAFKNTLKRSALRITRESELLGGQLTSYHTREAVVLEANFIREHLPYFTELLGEVVSQTKFEKHELQEDIEPVLEIQQEKYTDNALARAVDGAHSTAFHSGLGEALYPTNVTPLSSYLSARGISSFASAAYTRPNVAIAADGATQLALSKWIEPFFKDVVSKGAVSSPTSIYYGGQQRIESAGNSHAIVIGFSTGGLNAADPAASVLAALLGGESGIKWSPGFTLLSKATAGMTGVRTAARNLLYSDAGLFTIQIVGGSAAAVRKSAEAAVNVLRSVASGSVSKEDLAKSVAKAKFDALTVNESGSAAVTAAGTAVLHGLKSFQVADVNNFSSVTADKLKTVAKKFVDSKASYAAVGDLHVLPYAEDLGLQA